MQPGTTVIYKKYMGIIIRQQKEDTYIVELYGYLGYGTVQKEIRKGELIEREYEQLCIFN